MTKRYSVLLITVVILAIIVILECFTEDEDKITQLPVNVVTKYEFVDGDTNVNISLFEINSKQSCAKIINKEIRNIFETNALEIINNINEFKGTYQIATEYSLVNGLLSLKIYETNSNVSNTSGNIYSVVYDIKNDMEWNLSGAIDYLKLDYNSTIDKVKKQIYNKNKYVYCELPYIYFNSKGNLEIIARSLIQVDKYSFWNNIEIYEIETNDENENENIK